MRWWTYQKERFPLFQHGPLVAAFSACAVSYSALLTGVKPEWQAYLVAFVTCLLFFFQLRIADEFKDADEDAQFRPYRPVPRGLVSLRELGVAFVLAAACQLGFALWFYPPLLWALLLAWLYLALMSVEFFARNWLKARPITYLWTHMLIMPIVDFYATACHWMPAGQKPWLALIVFLAASFCNGLVIEIGRKLRQPDDEEDGVPTYSKLWGLQRGAWVWLGCMAATTGFAVTAAVQIGFALPVSVVLGLLLGFSTLHVFRWKTTDISIQFITNTFSTLHVFRWKTTRGSRFELLSGVWTLVLYLILGVIPLLLK